MKELSEYRSTLIDRLVHVAQEFRTEALAVKDAFTQPDDGWNVHQIAVHTRDIDKLVYGLRARRTANEDNPEFQNFDGELYMAEHYSAEESLSQVLEELVGNVEDLAQVLRTLPVDAWSRQSRHATLGHGFTMQTWVERDLAHLEEHLETIKNRKEM